ncbi:beta-galactosidase/beta-glucuronidase [Sphaerochaeta pleomorpha str. Grapes]|uniref:Beta-galactosidase/beta-glucuronidase n=1 Tax=Sphaerochaeta pleomorpha (strain ATCC BAA-1885 / DSM 22778 / Grapes) TaxID=158190 RepID=G8QR63_SPHPG|nr:glycoside hydrolase family 2 TIM barrel-domain containing protein [Sphaerochaeta pleomorpha]AEV30998.1 beta-galactosidase/beta-glucuronidase [Sphaerochaeta pleomorpha str. Grapes]
MHISEPLNFAWLFTPSFDSTYTDISFDDSHWELVDLPHANRYQRSHYFDEKDFCFVSCYRKHLKLDCPVGMHALLRFEGVASRSEVYGNGILLCTHEGGYTPFEVELPLKKELVLTVVVDSRENPKIPPFGGSIDYLTFGGLYRTVTLHYFHQQRITACQVVCENPSLIFFRAEVKESDGLPFLATLYDGESEVGSCEGLVLDGVITEQMRDLNLQSWSTENAKLYTFCLSLDGFDTFSCKIGSRTARFEKDGFYLNGKKKKLIGLDRHQSYPYVGYAMPPSMQRDDALQLKQLGVDIVRTSHYPQDPSFLDACDELGLLVLEEIPGWQHISSDQHWRKLCVANVRDMIVRDYNHPSIVLWGVRINESPDDDALYEQTNAMAHKTDATRQTGGIRNFAKSHLLEDVYTYNDFSHSGKNAGLAKKKDICLVDAPYLVTEFNGHMFPTKRYDNPIMRSEHALRHYRVLDSLYATEGVSGAIGWCMNDYTTHSNFGSGDQVCYHGVCDQFRLPKLAAYAYQAQQDEKKIMVVSSTMDIGDFPFSSIKSVLVCTNCDSVNLYYNTELVGSFLPDRKQFSHLPHPPVVIEDLIGKRFEAENSFSPKDRQYLKNLLIKVGKQAAQFTLGDKLKMFYFMKKYKISYDAAVNLYSRYVGNWGSAASVWKFEGVCGGKVVCTEVFGGENKPELHLEVSKTTLQLGPCYDVAQISVEIRKKDMMLPLCYAHEAFTVSVQGPISLLSPSLSQTEGGTSAIYVRTTGTSGKATVTVHSNLGDKMVAFTVG